MSAITLSPELVADLLHTRLIDSKYGNGIDNKQQLQSLVSGTMEEMSEIYNVPRMEMLKAFYRTYRTLPINLLVQWRGVTKDRPDRPTYTQRVFNPTRTMSIVNDDDADGYGSSSTSVINSSYKSGWDRLLEFMKEQGVPVGSELLSEEMTDEQGESVAASGIGVMTSDQLREFMSSIVDSNAPKMLTCSVPAREVSEVKRQLELSLVPFHEDVLKLQQAKGWVGDLTESGRMLLVREVLELRRGRVMRRLQEFLDNNDRGVIPRLPAPKETVTNKVVEAVVVDEEPDEAYWNEICEIKYQAAMRQEQEK